jgi:hypothetical protein
VADVNGIGNAEMLNERCQIVGVGVEVIAVPRLRRPAMASTLVRDRTVSWLARKNIWSSKASALSGQPWLKTTGRPLPQSL